MDGNGTRTSTNDNLFFSPPESGKKPPTPNDIFMGGSESFFFKNTLSKHSPEIGESENNSTVQNFDGPK
jgi:hypothetical protein